MLLCRSREDGSQPSDSLGRHSWCSWSGSHVSTVGEGYGLFRSLGCTGPSAQSSDTGPNGSKARLLGLHRSNWLDTWALGTFSLTFLEKRGCGNVADHPSGVIVELPFAMVIETRIDRR